MNKLDFGTRRLVSQEESSLIERPDVPRSTFSGSWAHKTTFNAAELIPFLVEEILPGDHIRYNVTAYVRMATPLFPLFSNQQVDTFFFFVPNRIVWENWNFFMGETDTAGAAQPDTLAIPTIELNDTHTVVGTMCDYFGIPIEQLDGTHFYVVNALPFRAALLCYNEWFRDQNQIDKVPLSKLDTGDDVNALNLVRIRGKAHDYFTTCLPRPQKFTAPNVPVAGQAPVHGIGFDLANVTTVDGVTSYRESDGLAHLYANVVQLNVDTVGFKKGYVNFDSAGTGAVPQIFADLTLATGVSINQLRESFLIQQLLERDARGGTRYTEILKAHFGVTSPDARLQRPEYIGGGSTPLTVTPIAQTAPSTEDPVGKLGGAGTAVGQHSASVAATEHGFVIGYINVRSELAYQQGINRMFSRSTRYDYYWPSLAGLGEQAVLRQEILALGHEGVAPFDDDDAIVFGYQERWHEYRTRTSHISGYFRSGVTGSIDQWHLAQDFGVTAPVLGQDFIEDNPPMARVLAAGELAAGMQYLADIFIQRQAVRPLPMFGTPVSLGRF